MNPSRRGFLKKLSAVAVSTAFPLSKVSWSPLETWSFRGTTTGRWSSNGPAWQNLDHLTETFVALRRSLEHTVVQMNYLDSEMRILAQAADADVLGPQFDT